MKKLIPDNIVNFGKISYYILKIIGNKLTVRLTANFIVE